MNFNNPDVVVQSWFIVAKSESVKAGRAKTFDVMRRKLTIYRDHDGNIHALDARCPHLGADLGLGKVVDGKIQCPFHHWTVDGKGRCSNACGARLSRRARIYPTAERWGYIWVFNGPKPSFDIPTPPDNYVVLKTPEQHIKCHPHIITCNGMDVSHFGHLHGVHFEMKGKIKHTKPYTLTVRMEGHPTSKLLQFLVGGDKSNPIRVDSSTLGGHMAWLEVFKPIHYYVLFTTRHAPKEGAITNVFFFAPSYLKLIRAIFITQRLLHDDSKILNTIQFFPGFSEEDITLKEYFNVVNSMETW